MKRVLVVDDKDMMRDSVAATLGRAGFEVEAVCDGPAAMAAIASRRPDAIVTDMRMPGLTGIELLEQVRRIDDELPVVIMTAFGTIDTAVRAIRMGAFDYLTKPFEGDELVIAVKRAVEHARLVRENAVLRAASGGHGGVRGTVEGAAGLDRLLGTSDVMKQLRDQLAAIAASQGTVLVTGESGVGKEVVARAIHEASGRRDGTYLAVNCAALSESLLESELFGHERGSFTGADRLRKGRFELADGGTLLLDEVSEVAPSIQAKLLRVLQERSFERVGASVSIGVDVRVIATSNRDLPSSAAKGEFRQDLYFRLSVLPVRVPPLRERREDIEELARYFIGRTCRREGRACLDLDSRAVSAMREYAWPGNVRELQNICERAVVLSSLSATPGVVSSELISPWLVGVGAPPTRTDPGAALGPSSGAPAPFRSESSNGAVHLVEPKSIGGTRALEEIEREAILAALDRFEGHRQKTARALKIGVRTLGLKLKKWKQDGILPMTA
jgi:DNA-binding NtrC family response regulator